MSGCPACGGEHWPDHPAGRLTYQHRLTCPLLRHEDATRAHDQAQRTRYQRPATAAERALLESQGATLPDALTTYVDPLTRRGELVRRDWPQLTDGPPTR